ncbi:MAG TPA: surface-adhesin E family protein [Burkholderiales bacterium]|nr:surface-adhesin E family protein [Burkholderiales bacterium]
MRNTIEMLFGSGVTSGTSLEWVKAGSVSADGGYDTYVDLENIRRSEEDTVKMWHLHDFKTAQVVAGMVYLSSKNQVEYDCKNRLRRTLYFSWNAENMGAGASIYRRDTPSEWKPVLPGTIAEILWNIACAER